MVKKLSDTMAVALYQGGYIAKEDIEVSTYGIQLVVSTLLIAITIIIASNLTGTFSEAIVFCVMFAILRNAAGGKHAKSYLTCYILSVSVCLIVVFIAKEIINLRYIVDINIVLMIISVLLVMIYAPQESKNKPLNKEEYERYKIKSRIIICIQAIVIIILFITSNNTLGVVATLSIFIESLTLIPFLNQKGGEVS